MEKEWSISEPKFWIGRSTTDEVSIVGSEVKKHHLKVWKGENGQIELKTKYEVSVKTKEGKVLLEKNEWTGFELEKIKRIKVGD